MTRVPVPTRCTFLVAEEDAVQRMLLREVLQTVVPCRVCGAGDVTTALAHAHAQRPDLIVLDAELPPDGAEAVLTRLRADPHLSQVPVVVLAYSRAPADRASITAFARTHWLEKPYDLAELERSILTLLPTPSARVT